MRKMVFAAFLLAAGPALAQQQQPVVNSVTGAPFPSPFQALGNVLRGQTPAPPPPSSQTGQPPLPTAIPPMVPPQNRTGDP